MVLGGMSRSLVIALVLAVCAAPLACSDEAVPPGGNGDATTALDAAPRDAQAEPTDSGDVLPDSGSAPADSGVTAPDAEPADSGAEPADTGVAAPDAEPADSGDAPADAGGGPNPSCGLIGRACNAGNECGGGGGSGLDCVDPPGLCMPTMPTCGGFVQARCPGLTPVCMFYRGADYGPCLTVDQRNCICNDPNARQFFPDC